MCGVTDIAFRRLCRNHSNVITCTEMLSARALQQQPVIPPMLENEGVQLVGNDTKALAHAAALFPKALFVELNAGCPVKKVVKKGHGSAMLKNPDEITKCADALAAATDSPITVKIRVGWGKNDLPEIAKAVNASAASRVVVHARTAKQNYFGGADWGAIKAGLMVPGAIAFAPDAKPRFPTREA